jgi:hypothetical protein
MDATNPSLARWLLDSFVCVGLEHARIGRLSTMACIALALPLGGCATRHYSELLLYKCDSDDCKQQSVRDDLVYGSNPVFIRRDAKFTVELSEVSPGWIHQKTVADAPDADSSDIKRRESQHLRGKELWLVTRVVALKADSPLELEGKGYYKISNIKLGSGSFAAVPLDSAEQLLFSHKADTAYRMTVRVYEVDAFEIKRTLGRTYRDNPGLWGLASAAWSTFKSTVGSLVGDTAASLAKNALDLNAVDDPLLMEAILLQSGATIELSGTLHLYTEKWPDGEVVPTPGWEKEEDLVLYDLWKSDEWNFSFSNRDEYEEAQEKFSDPIAISNLTGDKSFMRLVVKQSIVPKEPPSDTEVNAFSPADVRLQEAVRMHQAIPED